MAERLAQLHGFAWLHRVWDGLSEAADELKRVVGVPLCVEGCGLCCTTNTPSAMGIEVRRAASWLISRPQGEREKLLDQIEAWLLRPVLEVEEPNDPRLGVRSPRKGDLPVLPTELRACVRGRCPLLGEDLRCRVYEVRPLACRAYGITHLPGRYCKRPQGLGETAEFRYIYEGAGVLRLKTLVAGLKRAVAGSKDLSTCQLFPTALFAYFRPQRLRALVPQIPTARLAGGKDDPSVLWDDPSDVAAVGAIVGSLEAPV